MVVTTSSMVRSGCAGWRGRDDYIAKPFGFCRAGPADSSGVAATGNRPANACLPCVLAVDRVGHTVQRGGHNIELKPKGICAAGVSHAARGTAGDADSYCRTVWKLNFDTMTNVVDVYINYLRRKMDTGYDHALIRTVRGVGYQIGGNGAVG